MDRADIQVYVNGVQRTDYTWTSTGFIVLAAAPAAGAVVLILRRTLADTGAITFNGGIPTPSLLQGLFRKLLYIAQEALQVAKAAMNANLLGQWDALGKRIVNVADPVAPTDAANQEWVIAQLNATATALTASIEQWALIQIAAGASPQALTLYMQSLPTALPMQSGVVWNNSGQIAIS